MAATESTARPAYFSERRDRRREAALRAARAIFPNGPAMDVAQTHLIIDEAIEAFEAADWQPISVPPRTTGAASSERLLGVLKNGTRVFCYYTPFYLGHERESEKLWTCEGWEHDKPTHWMYLPDPPTNVK